MTHRDGVVTAAAEAATNSVASVLSSSESARRHSKLYHFSGKIF